APRHALCSLSLHDALPILDLDRSQQTAVDHIMAGESLVVSAPPGTGQTQTAVAAAVGLATKGKRVLVVAENTSTLTEFTNRLARSEEHTSELQSRFDLVCR